MVKILHTADLHLREYGDERWEALRELIQIGKQNRVGVFAICGDLFDKDIDAENLRPRIRELFSNTDFKVLIIPGNHDKDSYQSGMYFGEDVFVLGTPPFQVIELESVKIAGIPFEPIQGGELLRRIQALREVFTPNKKSILMCHGELLDAFYTRADLGLEGEARYMPFKLSYFEGLNVDYVLGGHFHSKFDIRRLGNGGYFVYPGSPVSITRAETGQRKANLFEVGDPPGEFPLDTFHFEEITIALDPLRNESPVETVRGHFERLHPKATAILTVKGYINSEQINMTEPEIVTRINEMARGRYDENHYPFSFRDISRILENDLFIGFTTKARESGCTEEEMERLQDITIRAMMQADL